MSLEAAAATGTGLTGAFQFAATHGVVLLGVAALAVTTGVDIHSAAMGVVEPFLG